MTVINMLSFGEEGVAVADEQSSTYLRKYNVAQKLNLINSQFIYGGSGPADFIKVLYETLREEAEKIKKERSNLNLKEIYRILNNVSICHRNQLKDTYLNTSLGISLDDLLTGVLDRRGVSLDQRVKEAGSTALGEFNQHMQYAILLGGIENGRFSIYSVDSQGTGIKISRPYASVGSGSDESEKVLSSYVSRLPRDKRDSIDVSEGLLKIIEATNSSARLNVGVGGSFSVVYVGKNGIIIPNENQCILASEIVEGFTNGLLDKSFSYDALKKLVTENGDFESIDEQMWSVSKDSKRLSRILRGYKE